MRVLSGANQQKAKASTAKGAMGAKEKQGSRAPDSFQFFEIKSAQGKTHRIESIPRFAVNRFYSMPSFSRAAGLRRSGLQGGVQTTLTLTMLTPGSSSILRRTSSLIPTCEAHPRAVMVMSTSTSMSAPSEDGLDRPH